MTGVSGAPYQPPVKFVLGRLAHETYSQSYVTWAEVKSDLELRSRSEALMLANGHARRQGLPHLIDEDKHRCSTEVRVRNEDCYQLAAQGYTWGEIARLAGVDSEDNACRHARTFAYRARRDDG